MAASSDATKNDAGISTSKDVSAAIESAKSLVSKKLDLSRRLINEIPAELNCLQKLEYLYLERNELQYLPDNLFTSLPHLKWLDLRNNKLKEIPANIGESRFLRSLLLENNQLQHLPLELGLVQTLSGLHLAGNPLEFPSENIIEQGTQVIISFLRDLLLQKQQDEGSSLSEKIWTWQNESSTESESRKLSDRRVKSSTDQRRTKRNDDIKKTRRLSLEEGKVAFKVTSSTLSDPSASKQRRKPTDFGKTRLNSGYSSTASSSGKSKDSDKRKKKKAGSTMVHNMKRMSAGLLKNEPIETKMQEEMRKAEEKIKNAKIDAIIQQRRNKQELADWRRETQKIQRQKNMVAARHGLNYEPIPPPFGTNDQKFVAATKHGQQVSDALENMSKAAIFKMNRDRDILEKIDDHVRKLRVKRFSTDKLTPSEEVEFARQNLEQALKLRDELEEKRALEYRLRAFTAEEYAPQAHAAKKK